MSNLVRISILSAVWSKVQAESGIFQELSDHFTFEVPNAKFHPLVKAKKWDGKLRLLKNNGLIYTGLASDIRKFCLDGGYDYEMVDMEQVNVVESSLDEDKLNGILEQLKDHCGLVPRDYQLDGLLYAIKYRRAILISPTASGKSLIIHLIMAYFGMHSLLVVPTKSLVAQMQKDLISYGMDEESIQIIMEGRTKEIRKSASIVISTWQSLANVEPNWFEQFEMLMIDEVHTAKAKSLVKIAEQCPAVVRVGTTGTLDNIAPNMLTIIGLFGPVKQLTTTKIQMDKGNLSKLNVHMVRFNYASSDRRELTERRAKIRREQNQLKLMGVDKATGAIYNDEIEFLIDHVGRRAKIVSLVSKLKGNTIVLFHRVDRDGKPLYEAMKEALPDKQVVFISGETEVDIREDVRQLMEENDNVIVVGSIAVLSTGVNIRNLHNAVAVAPTKSLIRVLQSIGRTLRLHSSKDVATWVDIVDDLSWANHDNYAVQHAADRIKIYKTSKFDLSFSQEDIW